VLKVERVSAGYGPVPVLREVSLEVGRGEAVAVVGANNAGKSTLLRIITGLLFPSEGKVWLDGRDITYLPPEARVNLGVVMVPEGRGIFPDMTVLENLLMGSYNPRGKAKRRENLERVFSLFPALRERQKQVAGTLSGGEQQMLALGRGIMAEPELLILDEPSLGLAPVLIRELFSVLEELNRQGLTILLVEQNMKMALSVTRRAYVILHGRVFLSGDSASLVEDERVKKAYLGLVE